MVKEINARHSTRIRGPFGSPGYPADKVIKSGPGSSPERAMVHCFHYRTYQHLHRIRLQRLKVEWGGTAKLQILRPDLRPHLLIVPEMVDDGLWDRPTLDLHAFPLCLEHVFHNHSTALSCKKQGPHETNVGK